MTERQRQLTKYLAHLTPIINAKYNMFFLRSEGDNSSRHMLQSNLTDIQTQFPNSGISASSRSLASYRQRPSAADSLTGDFYRLDLPFPRMEPIHIARDHFKNLQVAESLNYFMVAKRAQRGCSHPDSFLKPRIELNIALENYDEALSLAIKSRLPQEIFVCAIALGDYELAAGQLDHISSHLQDQGLVSMYEQLHLVMYVSFATGSSSDAARILGRVKTASNFDLTQLIGISELFVTRNFEEFVSQWRQWGKEIDTSMYASASKDKLRVAIENNVVANIARPYSKISFGSIASMAEISLEEVEVKLKIGIRAGKILGKLDMVSRNYVGEPEMAVERDLRLKFERIVSIREKYETLLWVKPFGPQLKFAKAFGK
jgi:hypothetical protein